MKFLTVWWWANENAKEVTTRFSKWKQKGKWKTLYPISTMVGRNKAFMVSENDDIAEVQKDIAHWADICTFDLIPIMDSIDAVRISLSP